MFCFHQCPAEAALCSRERILFMKVRWHIFTYERMEVRDQIGPLFFLESLGNMYLYMSRNMYCSAEDGSSVFGALDRRAFSPNGLLKTILQEALELLLAEGCEIFFSELLVNGLMKCQNSRKEPMPQLTVKHWSSHGIPMSLKLSMIIQVLLHLLRKTTCLFLRNSSFSLPWLLWKIARTLERRGWKTERLFSWDVGILKGQIVRYYYKLPHLGLTELWRGKRLLIDSQGQGKFHINWLAILHLTLSCHSPHLWKISQ